MNYAFYSTKLRFINVSIAPYGHSMGLLVHMHYECARNTEYKLQIAQVDFQINKKTNVSLKHDYALVHALLLYCTIMWGAAYHACMQKLEFFAKSRERRHCWCSFQRFSEPILLIIFDFAN